MLSENYASLRAERRINVGGVDEYSFKARLDPFSGPLNRWFSLVDDRFAGFASAIKPDSVKPMRFVSQRAVSCTLVFQAKFFLWTV